MRHPFGVVADRSVKLLAVEAHWREPHMLGFRTVGKRHFYRKRFLTGLWRSERGGEGTDGGACLVHRRVHFGIVLRHVDHAVRCAASVSAPSDSSEDRERHHDASCHLWSPEFWITSSAIPAERTGPGSDVTELKSIPESRKSPRLRQRPPLEATQNPGRCGHGSRRCLYQRPCGTDRKRR